MQDLWELCHQGEGPALFDMDGTLFAGDLGETSFFVLLACELLHKEPQAINASDITLLEQSKGTGLEHILGSYSSAVRQGLMKEAYAITADYVQTLPYAKVLSACIRCFEAFGDNSCSFLFDGVKHSLFVKKEQHMLAFLQACLHAKKAVFLVSASPLQVVIAFCEMFALSGITPIAADTRHELPYGPGKVERLAQAGVLAAQLAFGNSIGDREMLQLARFGVLRNPGDDTVLRTLAQEKAWMIVD